LFKYVETTQADFNSGTLTDVVATSAGDLQLATGKKLGTREKVIDLSEIGANNYGNIINFTKTDAVVTNATFGRASVAYLEDGTEVEAGQPRFGDGKFGRGVLIEEGTTNLATAGHRNIESLTGIIIKSGSPTISISEDWSYIGTKSLKVVGSDTSNRIQITDAISRSDTSSRLTYSAYIYNPNSTPIAVYGGNYINGNVTIPPYSVGRLEATTPEGVAWTSIGEHFYEVSGKTFYLDAVQIEEKPYATSFVDGTRAVERCTIPTTGVLNPTQGTISLWVKPPKGVGSGGSCLWATSGTQRFDLWWSGNDRILIVIGSVSRYSNRLISSLQDGNFHAIAVTWGSFGNKLYIDGVLDTSSAALVPSNLGSDFYIGSYKSFGYESNSIIDELRIDKIARTDEEIAAWYNSDEPMPFQSGCAYKMNFDNNLQATVGTVNVEAALSTDGGDNYSQYNEVKSGLSIPGLACDTDLTNGRLKIKETLYTSDDSVTPKLHDLGFNITKKLPTTVYGSNKSTLTAWDSISLVWKPERLSLVVNDEEACYIENPGLPASLGSHIYIGTDRNGANAINTLVDELRIDKVYREVNIRTGWHKTGVPFYTSEDMKQWPGYLRAETDGLKVYDSSDDLRVLVGSWVEDAIRKYGIRIIDGLIEASKIYGTSFQSGQKGATSYVRIGAGFEPLEIKENGKTALNIWSSGGGMMQFYNTALDSMMGQISVFDDAAGTGLRIHARNNAGSDRMLLLRGTDINLDASGTAFVENDLWVSGTIYSGSKSNVEITENYGIRTLVVRESPDHKYIVEGVGEITNGTCRIDIEPMFLECIEPNTVARWIVQLTPYAQASLWVSEIADTYFVASSDIDQIEFAWTLSAYRKNFADIYLPEYVSKGVR
jgi:hypothetical protein